ncbi:MAG: FMN-binding protein [Oscillospiraceae bacterium]
MKSNVKKEFVIPIVVLTVICLVVSGLLAGTDFITRPIIAEAERQAAENARTEVLPKATGFQELHLSGLPEGVLEVYEAENGVGIVVQLCANGYGGEMKIMVGLNADGTISGTKTLAHAETQGLGSKTTLPKFQDPFKGKGTDLEGVSTIGGATISSNCFIGMVKKAFDVYAIAGGGVVENPIGLDEKKLKNYYPAAASFTPVEVNGIKGIHCDGKGTVVYATEKGYGGDMVVAVLFDPNDIILGVVIDRMQETSGIGSKVAEVDFTKQFVGKSTVESIDTISNATVSSMAVKKAVLSALSNLATVKGA